MTDAGAAAHWYWCVQHRRPEAEPTACPPGERLGPYESREAAEHWRERVEARNDRWDEEDRAWSGDEEE